VIVLETERLRLRTFRPSDLDDLFELYRDPQIRRYFPDGTRTYEQTREELEWFSRGAPYSLWATELKEDGAFVGRCGLLPWTIEGRDEVEVAYMIGKPWQRRGLATEAACALVRHGFESLGLERIIALIDPAHAESIAVARRAGLSHERDLFFDGVNSAIYAVTRP
jgi:ribosomal-protein-alanine N-acetyltransferase